MKSTLLLFISFIFVRTLIAQTTYYVSSSEGDDMNSGTQPEQAWRTLNKVNSLMPKPGDQVLFNSDDEWTGTIKVNASGTAGNPIVYGAFGTGSKPKIYGSQVITGWTLHSGNIWKAALASTDVKQLFSNGERMQLARYPNEGYYTITSKTSNTAFTSTDLNSETDYADATCMIRTNAFTIERKTVNSSSSQTITLSSAPSYEVTANYGFWLVNKLEFLTRAGEWYYDTSGNTLYFWTPNGDSPANFTVRASTVERGIDTSIKSYITVQDLEFLHHQDGVYVSGLYNQVFNCTITFPDVYGVHSPYSETPKKVLIDNNTIFGANGNAIRSLSGNASITNNSIENTGQLSGINKTLVSSYGNNGTAIFVRFDDHTIHYNRIINSGYNGTNSSGLNVSIKYNFINGACQVLDDGAGIYVTSSSKGSYPKNDFTVGTVIDQNIVLNVYGNRTGSLNTNNDSGVGIYLDWEAKGITVTNNIVSGTTYGIYVRSGGLHEIKYNTIIECMMMLRFTDESLEPDKIEFKNNLLYQTSRLGKHAYSSILTHQKLMWPNVPGTTFDNDYNTYIAHYYLASIFRGSTDFADWKTDTGTDLHSTFDGTALAEGETEKLFYNDTKETKVFELGDTIYRRLDGSRVEDTLTLDPFTSIILIKTAIISHNSAIENKTLHSIAYPNPTNGIIYLKINNVEEGVSTITIFNMQGEKVLVKQLITSCGEIDDILNISHLPEGCYLIQVNYHVGTDRIKMILKKDK